MNQYKSMPRPKSSLIGDFGPLESAPQDAQALMVWKLPTLAKVVHGWSMNTDTMGVYGNYYLKRAIVTQLGLGANLPEDAIYPLNIADNTGRPLEGSHKRPWNSMHIAIMSEKQPKRSNNNAKALENWESEGGAPASEDRSTKRKRPRELNQITKVQPLTDHKQKPKRA